MNNTAGINASPAWSRVKSHLGLKLAMTLVLNPLVYLPYYFLQHHHFFPAIMMRPGILDRMIPFSDSAVWIYLSIYLLMPVAPLLMDQRRQFLSYALGVVLISFAADVVFVFWPTFCVRPEITGANALYRSLVAIDNPFHAFPSLHAAFAVYTALCSRVALRGLPGRVAWTTGIWVWTFSILYATLATRQHVMADIIAGAALATAIYYGVFTCRLSSSFKKPLPSSPALSAKINQPTP